MNPRKINKFACEIALNSVNLHSEKITRSFGIENLKRIKTTQYLGPIAQLVRAPDS